MMIFLVGIMEMIIVTVWTKTVTKTQVLASGLITVVNTLIWYYVLETIVRDISDFTVVLEYALGCAAGTMIGTYFFGQREKVARIKKEKKDKLISAMSVASPQAKTL